MTHELWDRKRPCLPGDNGAWLGGLSLLQEKVGYPWVTLPGFMFSHAAAGYGGHGTLCGALGVCSCIIFIRSFTLLAPTHQRKSFCSFYSHLLLINLRSCLRSLSYQQFPPFTPFVQTAKSSTNRESDTGLTLFGACFLHAHPVPEQAIKNPGAYTCFRRVIR